MSEPIQRHDSIEALKDRVPLSAVLQRSLRLTRQGREFVALCPFHADKNASLSISDEKGFYHCFACGAHGDHVSFLREIGGARSFFEARDILRDMAGVGAAEPAAVPKRRVVDPAQAAADRAKKIADAVKRWGYTRPAAGTLVETYLAARGLDLRLIGLSDRIRFGLMDYWYQPPKPEGATEAPKPIKLGRWPAMVTALQDGPGLPDPRAPDRPHGLVGVHVTWLSDDGRGKRHIPHPVTQEPMSVKKMFGVARGAGMRLYRPAEVMAVGEGIETVLSARMAGWRGVPPGALSVWAAGSLDNIAGRSLDQGERHPTRPRARLRGIQPDPEDTGMALPPECKTVLLIQDNDNGDPPMAESIYRLAAIRWQAEGRAVYRVVPPEGNDLNDILRGERRF